MAKTAGVSEAYLAQALHYLARTGWVVRLRKGLYAVSSSTPGSTPAHEFEIAMALVEPAAISHWSALHYHGLTQQTPQRVFVLTTTDTSVPRVRTAIRKNKDGYPVLDVIYQFVQVRPERYFGTEKVWVNEARVTITDTERTLLDGLMMPQYMGDVSEVLNAFQVRARDLDLDRIIAYALKLDAATAQRLGWVLEQSGVDSSSLSALVDVEVKGYRTLDSSGPRKGPYNRRWMIQENLPGRLTP